MRLEWQPLIGGGNRRLAQAYALESAFGPPAPWRSITQAAGAQARGLHLAERGQRRRDHRRQRARRRRRRPLGNGNSDLPRSAGPCRDGRVAGDPEEHPEPQPLSPPTRHPSPLSGAEHQSLRASEEWNRRRAGCPPALTANRWTHTYDAHSPWRSPHIGVPPCRAAVLLRYGCDLTQPAVAQALKTPEGTVKVRLHRARQRLHREPDRQ